MKKICLTLLLVACFANSYAEDKEKIAAATGAAVGGGSAVAAVAALGVPGLGAVGITSGLAAVGAIVGGGMATGLVITAAAPVAVGVAFYGGYKLVKGEPLLEKKQAK